MGITIMMIACSLMMTMVSPIKVAFTVTTSSVLVGIYSYMATTSMFPSCSVVLSFSSGMMILFCYCALMTNYESKSINYKTSLMVVALLAPSISSMEENQKFSNNVSITENMNTNTMLCVAMTVIIVTMVCINKSMFKPSKSLVESY